MGQKVDPKLIRLGITSRWPSSWFATKTLYKDLLHRDIALRQYIHKLLPDAGIANIEILRSNKQVSINIHSAKPGIIIGRQGASIEKLRTDLSAKYHDQIEVNIVEIKKPDLSAQVVADSIAGQVERRISYRRAAKQAVGKAIDAGAVGVKVRVSGRLNGVEIARSEFFKEGNIPLHTFRANVDYARSTSRTTYGAIGIKVWIYKGNLYKDEALVL
jgi:small subunit ribosomal protein S3